MKLIAFTPQSKVSALLRTEAIVHEENPRLSAQGLHPRTYDQDRPRGLKASALV